MPYAESLGTNPIKNMTQDEKAETSKNKLKTVAFLHYIHFCSYYWVGLCVVQMVLYFKMSWSIRHIVPLNGHFKSELMLVTPTKATSHKTYHMYSGVKKFSFIGSLDAA